MNINSQVERPPLRKYLMEGDFFIGAAIGSTLTKLALRFLLFLLTQSSAATGVEPSPCFFIFLARTTFVLESLPEAKNPGQDAFFGGFCLKQ